MFSKLLSLEPGGTIPWSSQVEITSQHQNKRSARMSSQVEMRTYNLSTSLCIKTNFKVAKLASLAQIVKFR